jgi:tetratricopeptide (TPR) repeat protein
VNNSEYGRLSETISQLVSEYTSAHPTHQVSLRLSIAVPSEGERVAVTVINFLGGTGEDSSNTHVSTTEEEGTASHPNDIRQQIFALANAGGHAEAVRLGQAAVRQRPSDARSHELLAQAYLVSSNLKDSIGSFNAALDIARTAEWYSHHGAACEIDVRLALGQCLCLVDQIEAGRDHFTRALEIARTDGIASRIHDAESMLERYSVA